MRTDSRRWLCRAEVCVCVFGATEEEACLPAAAAAATVLPSLACACVPMRALVAGVVVFGCFLSHLYLSLPPLHRSPIVILS